MNFKASSKHASMLEVWFTILKMRNVNIVLVRSLFTAFLMLKRELEHFTTLPEY